MKPLLPVWSIPLVLAIAGIVLAVGNLPATLGAIVGIETVLVCGYAIWRARKHPEGPRPITNFLGLLPGQLLILLMIALLDVPGRLAALWAVIPAATIAYDAVALYAPRGRARTSILIGLYAILWAVPIALLERVIAIRRGLDSGTETIVVIVFAVVGGAFILLGVFRHWRADKE